MDEEKKKINRYAEEEDRNTKIRKILAKSFVDLPVSKDLPRLARSIIVYDGLTAVGTKLNGEA